MNMKRQMVVVMLMLAILLAGCDFISQLKEPKVKPPIDSESLPKNCQVIDNRDIGLDCLEVNETHVTFKIEAANPSMNDIVVQAGMKLNDKDKKKLKDITIKSYDESHIESLPYKYGEPIEFGYNVSITVFKDDIKPISFDEWVSSLE